MSEASFEPGVDPSRRTWIAITCGAGAVGGAAVAVPFVSTFAPSERARAAGAAVQVDISALQPGEKMTVEWRGKPVWIVRRTPAQLEALKKTESQLADPMSARTALPNPDYAKNEPTARSSPSTLSASASARTWVARLRTSSKPARNLHCRMTGTAGSSAPATAPRLTWPAASSRTSPRLTTFRSRRTCTCPTPCCWWARTRRPEPPG
jgi:Rieske Fe-S protein